jgi:hypothetical protein
MKEAPGLMSETQKDINWRNGIFLFRNRGDVPFESSILIRQLLATNRGVMKAKLHEGPLTDDDGR